MAQDAPNQPNHSPVPAHGGLDDPNVLGADYRQRITPLGQPFLSPKRLEPISRPSMAVLNISQTEQSLGVIQQWPVEQFETFDSGMAGEMSSPLSSGLLDQVSRAPLAGQQVGEQPPDTGILQAQPIQRLPDLMAATNQPRQPKPPTAQSQPAAVTPAPTTNPNLTTPPVQVSQPKRLSGPVQRSRQIQRQVKQTKAKTLQSLKSQTPPPQAPAPVNSGPPQPPAASPPAPAIQTQHTAAAPDISKAEGSGSEPRVTEPLGPDSPPAVANHQRVGHPTVVQPAALEPRPSSSSAEAPASQVAAVQPPSDQTSLSFAQDVANVQRSPAPAPSQSNVSTPDHSDHAAINRNGDITPLASESISLQAQSAPSSPQTAPSSKAESAPHSDITSATSPPLPAANQNARGKVANLLQRSTSRKQQIKHNKGRSLQALQHQPKQPAPVLDSATVADPTAVQRQPEQSASVQSTVDAPPPAPQPSVQRQLERSESTQPSLGSATASSQTPVQRQPEQSAPVQLPVDATQTADQSAVQRQPQQSPPRLDATATVTHQPAVQRQSEQPAPPSDLDAMVDQPTVQRQSEQSSPATDGASYRLSDNTPGESFTTPQTPQSSTDEAIQRSPDKATIPSPHASAEPPKSPAPSPPDTIQRDAEQPQSEPTDHAANAIHPTATSSVQREPLANANQSAIPPHISAPSSATPNPSTRVESALPPPIQREMAHDSDPLAQPPVQRQAETPNHFVSISDLARPSSPDTNNPTVQRQGDAVADAVNERVEPTDIRSTSQTAPDAIQRDAEQLETSLDAETSQVSALPIQRESLQDESIQPAVQRQVEPDEVVSAADVATPQPAIQRQTENLETSSLGSELGSDANLPSPTVTDPSTQQTVQREPEESPVPSTHEASTETDLASALPIQRSPIAENAAQAVTPPSSLPPVGAASTPSVQRASTNQETPQNATSKPSEITVKQENKALPRLMRFAQRLFSKGSPRSSPPQAQPETPNVAASQDVAADTTASSSPVQRQVETDPTIESVAPDPQAIQRLTEDAAGETIASGTTSVEPDIQLSSESAPSASIQRKADTEPPQSTFMDERNAGMSPASALPIQREPLGASGQTDISASASVDHGSTPTETVATPPLQRVATGVNSEPSGSPFSDVTSSSDEPSDIAIQRESVTADQDTVAAVTSPATPHSTPNLPTASVDGPTVQRQAERPPDAVPVAESVTPQAAKPSLQRHADVENDGAITTDAIAPVANETTLNVQAKSQQSPQPTSETVQRSTPDLDITASSNAVEPSPVSADSVQREPLTDTNPVSSPSEIPGSDAAESTLTSPIQRKPLAAAEQANLSPASSVPDTATPLPSLPIQRQPLADAPEQATVSPEASTPDAAKSTPTLPVQREPLAEQDQTVISKTSADSKIPLSPVSAPSLQRATPEASGELAANEPAANEPVNRQALEPGASDIAIQREPIAEGEDNAVNLSTLMPSPGSTADIFPGVEPSSTVQRQTDSSDSFVSRPAVDSIAAGTNEPSLQRQMDLDITAPYPSAVQRSTEEEEDTLQASEATLTPSSSFSSGSIQREAEDVEAVTPSSSPISESIQRKANEGDETVQASAEAVTPSSSPISESIQRQAEAEPASIFPVGNDTVEPTPISAESVQREPLTNTDQVSSPPEISTPDATESPQTSPIQREPLTAAEQTDFSPASSTPDTIGLPSLPIQREPLVDAAEQSAISPGVSTPDAAELPSTSPIQREPLAKQDQTVVSGTLAGSISPIDPVVAPSLQRGTSETSVEFTASERAANEPVNRQTLEPGSSDIDIQRESIADGRDTAVDASSRPALPHSTPNTSSTVADQPSVQRQVDAEPAPSPVADSDASPPVDASIQSMQRQPDLSVPDLGVTAPEIGVTAATDAAIQRITKPAVTRVSDPGLSADIQRQTEPTVAQLLAQGSVPQHPASFASEMTVIQPTSAMGLVQPLTEPGPPTEAPPPSFDGPPPRQGQASQNRQAQQRREEQNKKQLDLRDANYLPPGVMSGVRGLNRIGLGENAETREMMQNALRTKVKVKAAVESKQGKPAKKISASEMGELATGFLPVATVQAQVTQEKEEEELTVDGKSFELLAREVYHLLQQRLSVEKERYGGYYRDRTR